MFSLKALDEFRYSTQTFKSLLFIESFNDASNLEIVKLE
jgi:hypothetical protein